jgi:glyoxylase-like metal-dependent hydrolase (beta-lactamase superfamily II)
MKPQQIGAFTISRVMEFEGPIFEPEFLFPDADQATIEANGGWLLPSFIDPASGRLIMSFHSYVVRTPRHTIVVDTCLGNDKQRPAREDWHMREGSYLEDLSAMGVHPEEVDFVMCTHLHVDHVGWNTRLVDGRWTPTFPNARYIFARTELEHWQRVAVADPGAEINHGSYQDSVLPVVEANQVDLVSDDHQIEDGIWLEGAPGHTPGNVMLRLRSQGEDAVLTGDTIQHPLQLARPDWSSRFCDDPDMSRISRTALIEGAADTPTLVLTGHFPEPVAGCIVRSGDAFRFQY